MHVAYRQLKNGVPPSDGSARAWSLKSHFLLFGCVLILPLAILAAVFLLQAAHASRQQIESRMLQVAGGIADAIDRELQRRLTILQTLAASPSLDREDFAVFHALASGAMMQDKAGIFLIDASTQRQLVNTYRPYGTQLPTYGSPETAKKVQETHTWQISDFFIGQVSQRPAFDIVLPIHKSGSVRYLLAMGLEPFMLKDILLGQKLSSEWVLNITDRNGIVLAHSASEEEAVGRRLPAQHDGQQPNTLLHITALDGLAASHETARSQLSGWQVAVSLPRQLTEGQVWRSVVWLAIWSVAALALTGALAGLFARLIARPITVAAKAAASLPSRMPVLRFTSNIREANDLMSAIERAGAELSDAEERRLTAVQSLRESNARKSAILESALDAIVAMDQNGHIVDFNPAAEKLFGHRRKDVLGKAVADVIVPERLREAHWTGLKHYRASNNSSVVGRRIEMPALRSDGTEFPSELAVAATSLDDGQLVFTASLRDITERKRAEQTERLLSRELQHRTYNLLAVIDALADRTLRGNPTVEGAREVFQGRLQALARTHRRLSEKNWSGITLSDIIRLELEPFSGRTKIDGPSLTLNSQYAQHFTLAVHELVTNAAKYGALSAENGEIDVSWTVAGSDADAHLKFQWRERGGPAVSPPVRQGFGSSLLKATLGVAEFEYAPEGFCYATTLPLIEVSQAELSGAGGGRGKPDFS